MIFIQFSRLRTSVWFSARQCLCSFLRTVAVTQEIYSKRSWALRGKQNSVC